MPSGDGRAAAPLGLPSPSKPRAPGASPIPGPQLGQGAPGSGEGAAEFVPTGGVCSKADPQRRGQRCENLHPPISSLCAQSLFPSFFLFLINASEQAVFIFRGPHTQVEVEEFSRRFRFCPPGGPARSMEALGLWPGPRPLPLQVTTLSLPQSPGGRGRASRGHSSRVRHLRPQDFT